MVLWLLASAAYAAAFGVAAGLPVELAALDGAVFGVVSGFEGLILWNVLKYGTAVGTPTANYIRVGRFSIIAAAGMLFVAVAVGAECLAVYLSTGSLTPDFAASIPARSLTVAAVYVCFVLWYSSADRSEAERIEASQAIRDDSPKPAGDAPETLERITVRGTGGRIEVIAIGDVVCIQAEGDYVAIVTPRGRWLKEGTMKYFEGALPADRFVRVHRSCIVAVGHISRIETSGRDHTLVLHGGGPVRISETGYRLLKRTLGL
jgi:hypothetical protein